MFGQTLKQNVCRLLVGGERGGNRGCGWMGGKRGVGGRLVRCRDVEQQTAQVFFFCFGTMIGRLRPAEAERPF